MYRSLATRVLGLSTCRDHELIELALTHRFQGVEVDLPRFQEQVVSKGIEGAARYWKSTPLKLIAAELPFPWSNKDVNAVELMKQLASVRESLRVLKCQLLTLTLMAGSDQLPYHENFEFHRQRLREIGEHLAEDGIAVAVDFTAMESVRARYRYPFVHSVEALLALLMMVDSPHVTTVVDLWNWELGGGSLADIEKLAASRIGYVLLADLPVGITSATAAEDQRLLPRGEGGVIDAVSVVECLSKLRYPGPISSAPHRASLAARSREEAVDLVAKGLDDIWQRAGLASASRPVAAGSSAVP